MYSTLFSGLPSVFEVLTTWSVPDSCLSFVLLLWISACVSRLHLPESLHSYALCLELPHIAVQCHHRRHAEGKLLIIVEGIMEDLGNNM
jgi:hypothetical protein